MTTPELHSSIVALVSLAAGIAAKHPDMGLCQLDKLRAQGIKEEQIATVIEIARHIRDEAAQKLDQAFDDKAGLTPAKQAAATPPPSVAPGVVSAAVITIEPGSSCCSSTASGQSCC